MPALFPITPARLRSSVGRLVRRLGLQPGGEPDGLGEDTSLRDTVLDQRVVVFFPEPLRNAYQLEQWLGPLAALDERHGVVVLTQDSRTTAHLRRVTTLPVLCVAWTATMEALVRRGSLALALYVSHHPRNFAFLRWPELAHVHLGHGDSDKAVSASNQLKAYDRVFVAGRAGAERVLETLMWFSADRLVEVGRPALPRPAPRHRPATAPATVLYAPTWEGAQQSMSYSSVATHGVALVRSLVAAGFRVVYRPHPRTGANRADVRAADAALRDVLAGEAVRGTGSTVDAASSLEDAFAGADLLVTDVSSVAVEWLPTGRPLVVTVPAEAGAVVGPSRLLDAVPRLAAGSAAAAGELARRCLADDRERRQREALVQHYLGGADPDAALTRFLEACDAVLRERDALRAGPARAAR
ncbi:CDP-Glycerol:Poly(glycerophosphate) glycerophosphotransferase [Geodermatophilus pulveris]|uniref:CDP-Glycerol:Poly(Glycerophosphate) glycerophosphotransferase n=1 Tax=Geodermatophilus pulveris TaxID=1564159 RepID=A0A239AZV4_9ACTN|nr:CDP-glycerol glycerophosphotransferase family protein [Geodermatophilus pulveris]SNS01256.1 CDP-Glycerol:Poly(glycerophosphate) glycerophosphotransferase [Geodermatophilus pulveris]